MSHRYHSYHSRRATRRLARRSQRNFIFTLIIIGALIYAAFTWILPSLIGGIGFIKNITSPSQKPNVSQSENAALAPPVLNIPYEATNSAQIDIKGFGTSNSKVKLYMDDDPKQTTDVSEDGSFIFKDVSLALGTNNIYGKTVDERGKESLPSKTIKLTYDNEKPPLNIKSPEDGKTISGDKKVTVSGNTNPGIKVFLNDSQIIVDKDGNFSSDIAINEGDNTISIKAIDAASNSTEVQRKVTYKP